MHRIWCVFELFYGIIVGLQIEIALLIPSKLQYMDMKEQVINLRPKQSNPVEDMLLNMKQLEFDHNIIHHYYHHSDNASSLMDNQIQYITHPINQGTSSYSSTIINIYIIWCLVNNRNNIVFY